MSGKPMLITRLELELLLDLLTEPSYYRVLFGHVPISSRLASDVVEYLLRITCRG